MHLDLALLLSEAKGELCFYKSEALKDVLYYVAHAIVVSGAQDDCIFVNDLRLQSLCRQQKTS